MNTPPGFYGKVPVLGDFVSRRLSPVFIRCWDDWLSRSIAESRAGLGDDWLEKYLTSPVWRFALGPGLCGEPGWVGVMIPSVDRVGRYFPLTLAGSTAAGTPLSWPLLEGDAWLDRLEDLALSALGDHFDLEAFDRMLCEHRWPGEVDAITEYPARTAAGSPLPLGPAGAAHPSSRPAFRYGGQAIQHPGRGCSLWVTAGSGQAPAHGLCWQGLPPAQAFAAMLGDADSLSSLLRHDWTFPAAGPPTGPAAADSGPPAPPAWDSAARSETGHRRAINEDAYLMRPADGVWAVADGMGGHESGDYASQSIIRALDAVKAGQSLHALLARVQAALIKANAVIRDYAARKGAGAIVGSTVAVFMARGERGCVTWAGDSRLYRLRAGRLEQLTRDHAWREPGPADTPPAAHRGNVITRAVGAYPELRLDTLWMDIQPGDVFLLCTDGLDKELGDGEIAGVLNGHAGQHAVDRLIQKALERGGRDNITVVLVERPDAPPRLQP